MKDFTPPRTAKNEKGGILRSDRRFYSVCYLLIGVLTIIVLYPIVYVTATSFSSPAAVARGEVWLWPVDFSLEGYKAVLQYKDVWIGYRNTIFYTLLGTLMNISLTLACAYPLSRKQLHGRVPIMFLFTFTMLFGGGMIPNYILIQNLKIMNTIWAMLLPGCMSVYNMIVARTFIQQNIPNELLEASKMDGCSDARFFFQVVLPLSKAIIAVLALWYAVGHWNAYFNAFLYLSDKELFPLQLFLKSVLVQNEFATMIDPELAEQMTEMRNLIKYALIVVSTAPLFAFYPFVQKYFVKGVMIGSVKG